MPPLIPTGHGNRRVDAFGNAHVRFADRGGAVVRDPGHYTGHHRREPSLPRWLAWLARWEGVDV